MRNFKSLQTVQQVLDSIVCDCCKTEVHSDDMFQFQERLSLNFSAGYGSVFNDGDVMECDLCQQCVQKLLGPYLRVVQNCVWGLDEPEHDVAEAEDDE